MRAILATTVRTMRLNFVILAPICVLVGIACLAAANIAIDIPHAILVFIAAICAHISANMFNEYFDFSSGLDLLTPKTPFSGGSGALPATPQAKRMVLIVAIELLIITCLIGMYLVIQVNIQLLAFGLFGAILIVLYSPFINLRPWLCWLTPGLAFGPIFVFGAAFGAAKQPLDQTTLSNIGLAAAIPFFLVNNLLLLNQLPDMAADREVGRRNLPVVYGFQFSLHVYFISALLAAMAIIALVINGFCYWATLLALLPLSLSFVVYWRLRNNPATPIEASLGQNVVSVLATNAIWALTVLLTVA